MIKYLDFIPIQIEFFNKIAGGKGRRVVNFFTGVGNFRGNMLCGAK